MNEIACVERQFIIYRIQNLFIALRQREKLSMASLRTIYFNEYNVLMGDATYLPLVSGLLHAAALTSEKVKKHYTIAPYIFHLDAPANIFSQYKTKPDVAAFSVMMWNEQLNLHVAREIKKRYPDVVIIFGGAQVPHHPEAYFREHPFIDVAVRGEGEDAFREILERLIDGQNLENLIGVTWRTRDGEIRGDADERPFERNLDLYPSPYLEGLYNELMKSRPDLIFQAIIETNRGCPFHCTFCYWGKGGLSRKYRYHGLDRIFAEIDWLGQNQIRYVFNADSNFGMHRRDSEIAEFLVATKKKYNFPDKFRTCYGKNTDEKIFLISNILHQYNMEKGITISYQSTDPQVQKNIKRDNIKLSVARELHRRFNENDVPVYTELILGLPGETTQSWRNGIDEILSSGLKNQLFIYLCQVYPNTDLADRDYQKSFGIITKKIDLNEIHGNVRHNDWVSEIEEIVIATDSMPHEDWRRMVMISWVTMMIHSLKLGFFVLSWLHDRFLVSHIEFIEAIVAAGYKSNYPCHAAVLNAFASKIDRLAAGEGRGWIMQEFGSAYWDAEEAAFLMCSADFASYFAELHEITREFLGQRDISFDPTELADIIRYQVLRIPTPEGVLAGAHLFTFNVGEYFATIFGENRISLERRPGTIIVQPRQFRGQLEEFARETIMWGRKSGTMLATVTWEAQMSATLSLADIM